MGIPGSANPMLFGGAAAYQINQSLRFNPADSARLYRTLAASQTRTYSFWYKYANLSGGNMYLFHHKNSGDTNYLGVRSGGSPSENQWQTLNQGSSYTEIASSRKYRDPSAWQHVLWKCTSTNVTMYVNGVEFASTGGANTSLSGGTLEIGARGSAEYFGGYIAEFHFVDGTAYNPSDFGETDTITGAWIPKRFSGTYGSNGAYLKFDPSATNGIGHDHSGNGNNFTATGFSTSGTGTDVMSDTPTNNWTTLNPITPSIGSSLSDGNLVGSYSSSSGTRTYGTTALPATGKFYFECTITGGASQTAPDRIHNFGLLPLEQTSFFSNGIGWFSQGTILLRKGDNTGTSGSSGFANNDVLQCAVDCATGKVWMGLNNSWYSTASSTTGDPAAGTNESATFQANTTYFPFGAIGCDAGVTGTLTFNFGQRAFAYTPPTGYKALSTGNLPEPTIKDGSKYFDTLIWTGDSSGANRTFSGLAFGPDLVWAKGRNQALSHQLTDIVRGAGGSKSLRSDTANAEGADGTGNGYISAFTSDGFETTSSSTNVYYNTNTYTYAAWCWDAGGAGSSNNAGSITSTVSANASAGFSIATYSANNTAGATFGHGLGVAPSMVIIKKRNAAERWVVYHQSISNQYIYLNETFAGETANAALRFGNDSSVVAPSSTLVTIGTSNDVNGASGTYVAYCFSEVAGYSKFGSYIGNGSSDGPFVFLGFRPAWIMIKDATGSGNSWYISDNQRNTYNVVNGRLMANLSNDESTSVSICDFTANGFKIRTSDSGWNTSSSTYVFACFAELPFKYSTAR